MDEQDEDIPSRFLPPLGLSSCLHLGVLVLLYAYGQSYGAVREICDLVIAARRSVPAAVRTDPAATSSTAERGPAAADVDALASRTSQLV